MSDVKNVLIMAGGTGGHIFPGLAVANSLIKKGIKVNWLGTKAGLEARLIPENQNPIPIHFISISGVRGKGVARLLMAPFKIILAILQALRIIHHLKPDVVLGMGGFVSGPGGVAAWLLGYPLVTHEQNAKAGLTNRWLAKLSRCVLQGFPDTFLRKKNIVTTGNPVRESIANIMPPQERFHTQNIPLHLLVIGGSLGAAVINDLVPRALARVPASERPLIYHQTGEKYAELTKNAYQKVGVQANTTAFISNMEQAYSWADIVLCRAGALTIAELCAAGVGAILVPYPYAVDDHQTANAQYLVTNGAAIMIPQATLTEEKLISVLKTLSASFESRVKMAQAAYALRNVDATNKVVEQLLEN